jgi:multiple sugar transport system substrate-binding protein
VPAGTQVSIKLASYLATIGTPSANTLTSLVQGFKALHPNIHVTVETETNSQAIAAQIQQDEVAGQAPDVVQDSFNDLKFIAQSLGALDLDQVVGKASVASEFGGPYRYAPAVTQLGVINGDVYGIPWTLSTPVLFYNANLFKAAGLNPADPPTTWAQVDSDAQAIHKATGASGLANGCVGAGTTVDWCLQALIYSDGGTVMNPSQTKTTFDSPGLVSALGTLQGLGKDGTLVNLTIAQAVQAWAAGKLAMVLDTSALQATLVKADAGNFTMAAGLLPDFGSTPSVPTNSGSALFIMSKKSLQREADWELIQYLTSPASETAITENIGYVPLRPSIASAPQYLETWAKSNPYLYPNLYQLEHLTPWEAYPGPNYAAIDSDLVNAATNVIFQGADPQSTMLAAQAQAKALMP